MGCRVPRSFPLADDVSVKTKLFTGLGPGGGLVVDRLPCLRSGVCVLGSDLAGGKHGPSTSGVGETIGARRDRAASG